MVETFLYRLSKPLIRVMLMIKDDEKTV